MSLTDKDEKSFCDICEDSFTDDIETHYDKFHKPND